MRKKKYLLLGSPKELQDRGNDRISGNFDFLLINVPYVCNHRCSFCWTDKTTFSKQQSGELSNEELGLIGSAFARLGGKSWAIMSDGEPLFASNLRISKRIVELSGMYNQGMLQFTNGELLTASLMDEFISLNPRTSFIVSLNGSSAESYNAIHGKGKFEKVMKNFFDWKSFSRAHQSTRDGVVITQFALHFVVTQSNKHELPDMIDFVDELDCSFVVTSPGMSGHALLNKEKIAATRLIYSDLKELSQKYSDIDGPLAMDEKNECSFISHSRNFDLSHGVTIHSSGGIMQVCPYYVGLGSQDWFSLRSYLDRGGEDVTNWLKISTQLSKVLTDRIYKEFGYNHCIKRHSRYAEIEPFLNTLNSKIGRGLGRIDPSDDEYLPKLTKIVNSIVS